MHLDGLRVNGRRLRHSLEAMADIGATPGGGVGRLALGDEDGRARDLLVSWLNDIELRVTIDEMGNIFGRRHGREADLPPVMTGSHADSQALGGRFDGILGVMGALEVMRTLHENHVETKRAVIVVDWTAEEGSRFAPSKLGSGVWAGRLDRAWVWERVAADGVTFGRELERIGYKGAVPCASWPFHAYYELHIEQGPQLEVNETTIGVPRGIVCLHVYDVYLDGEANQVGPTPMEGRSDALVAAAEMVLKVRALPAKMGGNLVATVGAFQSYPNCYNVISDHVHFTVDIRSWDDDLARRSWEDVRADFEAIAARHTCILRIAESQLTRHTEFDPRLVERVRSNAEALGHSALSLISGAGHDAANLAAVGPTAMVFVPSVKGRSHVEVERTSWEDCEAGANVLLRCVVQSATECGR